MSKETIEKIALIALCFGLAVGVWVYVQNERMEKACTKNPLYHTECVNLLKTQDRRDN